MPLKKKAFTLIEVAIVIVVIGLVIAGVMVGKDMVYSAEIRKTAAQFDKFNQIVITFKLKYGCLPGDCADALGAGLATTSAIAYGGNGNGNSKVDSQTEGQNFWFHLSRSHLLGWKAPATNPGFIYTCSRAGVDYSPCFEFSRIYNYNDNPAGWWILYGRDTAFYGPLHGVDVLMANNLLRDRHYWWITGRIQNNYGLAGVFMPLDASIVDAKVDDGLPLTGKTFAVGPGSNAPYGPFDPEIGAGGATSGYCVNNSVTPYQYNIKNVSQGNWRSYCSLMTQAEF